MSVISENTEADMRHRILVVAERLFRQIGYQKTTVADIAKVLQMSPANVYRFFDSKKAIHSGVARHLMGEVEQVAASIAAESGPAAERLRKLLSTVHQMNRERYVGDEKLHEMVAIAMEENWDVCVLHMQQIVGAISQVMSQGAASGEFDAPDIAVAAGCTCTAMMRFFHPQMIAQTINKDGPTLDQMIDFILRSLGHRSAAAAS
ncbi:TetR/AcrR family transcriptional regulator [Rhodopseudomonas sp. HC1]|uniref:TetR family transcriptional regulator n=1 Tax=Rhodopseudomonas infernalis TaxID=2897386 RepID=UPI001EE9ADD6|nr:TetR family transcriptional regulator [Rhodopseudomonas infernalis]MCG6207557.1 TetR/AcrR family transcriptional regulator [Rhodopseudomonas infernalis]